jgi:DNA-binding response OmpR family regulator
MSNRQVAPLGEQEKKQAVRFDTMRALVIGEDEILGKYQLSMLARLGIRGEWTAEREQAVKLLKNARDSRNDFTICLVNWQMSGSGEQMVRCIREQFKKEQVRIAAVPGDSDFTEKEMLAAGADCVLERPLSQSAFYSLMSGISKCI